MLELVNTNEITALSAIQLRPNPTSGQTMLDLAFETPVDVQIQIVNLLGQVIHHEQATSFEEGVFELNLHDYTNGIYLVRIQVDGQVHTQKLIKHK